MFFSKIKINILKKNKFSRYVFHQKMYEMFPGSKERDFVFHISENNIYLYSSRKPISTEDFFIEDIKEYNLNPEIEKEYIFKVKFNPVIKETDKNSNKVKKRDVIEHYRISLQKSGIFKKDKEIAKEAIESWFLKRQELFGFDIKEIEAIYDYQTEKINVKNATFKSITVEGVLKINNIDLFLETIKNGIGSSKGFGFGMIFLKNVK